MSHAVKTDELQMLAERVDQAVAEVRNLDQEAQRKALALKSSIEEFHKAGLTKIVQRLKADPRGKELLFELAEDPSVYALFAMHGLVRADLATRVSRVVEMLRPYLRSHGGDVELVEISADTARIRLTGACNGCSMPAQTLRDNFEEALKHNVPEIRNIEVVPSDPSPALIPLESLTAHSAPGWIAGPRLDDLADGELFRLDQGQASILIVRLGNRVQAFRNECAHQGLPLDGGTVDKEAGTIACPWHGFRYDGISGECLTASQAQLEPLPLRIENGIVHVRPL